jgi:mannose/cellobiose epimerase-like protein (N-acyl-D-glucosamine 2-epimerase family)
MSLVTPGATRPYRSEHRKPVLGNPGHKTEWCRARFSIIQDQREKICAALDRQHPGGRV